MVVADGSTVMDPRRNGMSDERSPEDVLFDENLDPSDVGPPKEVPGDFDGYIIWCNGNKVGRVEMDLPNGKMTFHWTGETNAWPASFTIEPPGTQSQPGTTHSVTFTHQNFTGSAASHDVSACQYALEFGGETVGWMERDANGSTWYGVPTKLTTQGLYDATSLQFVPNTHSGSVTAKKVYDTVT